jgi:hypothetical protein
MIKHIRNIAIGLVLALALAIGFSPFSKNYDNGEWEMEVSIAIDANTDSVYTYLSNSANASVWSSYIHHITPLNSDSILDGETGSVRRCFKNENEEGIVWDEKILQIQKSPTFYRELSVYNLHNFALQTDNLVTRQIYKELNKNETQLTFGLYKTVDYINIIDVLKMKLSGHYISYLFNKNLANIKSEIEKS